MLTNFLERPDFPKQRGHEVPFNRSDKNAKFKNGDGLLISGGTIQSLVAQGCAPQRVDIIS